MIVIKVKYSCIHSDNYQGGMGKVVIQSDLIEIEQDASLSTVLRICKGYVDGLTTKENFPIENPRMISMEIIETK